MNVVPIVRYLLLSQDFVIDPDDPLQITIVNLRASYLVLEDYPALVEEICCVAAVTDGRGKDGFKLFVSMRSPKGRSSLDKSTRLSAVMTPWS